MEFSILRLAVVVSVDVRRSGIRTSREKNIKGTSNHTLCKSGCKENLVAFLGLHSATDRAHSLIEDKKTLSYHNTLQK